MNEGLDCHLDLQIMRTACGGPETAKDITGEGTPRFSHLITLMIHPEITLRFWAQNCPP